MTDDLSDLTPIQRRAIKRLQFSDPRNVPHALEVMRNANRKRKRKPPRTMRCDHEFVDSNNCAKCNIHVSALQDASDDWHP